ncbi:MAG: GDSL-type esterase/lipase family protein [Cyclobacteriaceae bacterium]
MSNQRRILLLTLCLLVLSSLSFRQQKVIKVACVGDSITYGSSIENREENSYPAQLQKLLGDGWEVQNFGVSGATMLKNGDKPYWKTEAFQQALAFEPDVVIIKLGTNDSKPQNWAYAEAYETDYRAMIQEFRGLESQPEIWICLPVPVYEEHYGITSSVVDDEILPMIKRIKRAENVKTINLYKALSKKAEMFPDGIHPDAAGAKVMAETIAKKIKKAGGQP